MPWASRKKKIIKNVRRFVESPPPCPRLVLGGDVRLEKHRLNSRTRLPAGTVRRDPRNETIHKHNNNNNDNNDDYVEVLYIGQWVSDDCRGESLSGYPPPPDSQVRVHGTNARLTSRGRAFPSSDRRSVGRLERTMWVNTHAQHVFSVRDRRARACGLGARTCINRLHGAHSRYGRPAGPHAVSCSDGKKTTYRMVRNSTRLRYVSVRPAVSVRVYFSKRYL